tara:strand:+ start:3616 stop:3816 length:201 start_codon:yes stop_codon:yes gene_type:complete
VGIQNKKYYRFDGEKSVSSSSMILVKWIEGDTIQISNPIKDHNKALNKCHSYLQKGICSWMVYYDG